VVYSENGKQIFYYLTPTKDRQMTTTTNNNIPTGESVTAKFDDIDTTDTKRIVDTNTDTMRWIRRDGAWYELGLIMINLRDHVESEGGKRITTKMLGDAGIATISKERRRDGEALVTLEDELNIFINSDTAPTSITNVTKLLADYAASLKTKTDDEGDNDETETETDDDDATPMTAEAIAAQALTIAKAHNVSARELVEAIIAQVAPAAAAAADERIAA